MVGAGINPEPQKQYITELMGKSALRILTQESCFVSCILTTFVLMGLEGPPERARDAPICVEGRVPERPLV